MTDKTISEIFAPVVGKLERLDEAIKALKSMFGQEGFDALEEAAYVVAVHRYDLPDNLYGFHLLAEDGRHLRSYGTYNQERAELIGRGFEALANGPFHSLEEGDYGLDPARLGRCAPIEWKDGAAIHSLKAHRFAITQLKNGEAT